MEATHRYDTLPGHMARHIRVSALAFVQSLPERYLRPLPPWDVCFSGSIFYAPACEKPRGCNPVAFFTTIPADC